MKALTVAALFAGSSMMPFATAHAQAASSQAPATSKDQAAPQSEASAAAGQTDQSDSAEIVVTAQRRTERVQDVPIGISVVSGDQLARQQVNEVRDLGRTTASLQFGGTSNTGGGAFIRGIGTAALTRSAESAVGVVVDGVVQGNTSVNNLFDIARVEVLRGPQGTLFGQSVSAGVINISTLAPDPSRVSGKVITELSFDGFAGSEFGRQIVRGGVNLPVSATSAVRISGYLGNTAGIGRNALFNVKDKLREGGVRGRYLGEFGDVTINLIGDYNSSKGTDFPFFTYVAASPTLTAALTACGVTAGPGNREQCSSRPEVQRVESYGGSGQIDVQLGSLTLTSITALRLSDEYVSGDIDRVANNPGVNVRSGVKTDYRQLTQEVRLATDATRPLSLTLGGFYYNSRTDAEAGPSQGGTVTLPNGFVIGTADRNHTVSRNLSAFGEGRYHSGPFTIFAGARLTDSKISLNGTRQAVTLVGTIPNGALLSNNFTYDDTDLSWRVGAQFAPSRVVMFYGTVARGYKNAQASPIIIVNNITFLNRVIVPEKPTAYELGFKSTLLGGRLALNANVFYQRIRNLQAQTFVTLSDTPVPALLPANVSKVISKGIEADVFGRIGRHLTVNASAVYNVAKYPADYRDAANVSLQGQQIANAPRFASTFSGEYTRDIAGDTEAFISLDARYRSKVRLSDQQLAPTYTVDQSRWVFGGRVGARVADRWSMAIFANNLGKSRVPTFLFPALLGNPAAYYNTQAVRQVGLQAQLEF